MGIRNRWTTPVERVSIGATINTTLDAVAGVANTKIRILGLVFVSTSAVTVKIQSYNASTPADITGAMPLAANGQLNMPYNPDGWLETVAGDGVRFVTSGSSVCGGVLLYQKS